MTVQAIFYLILTLFIFEFLVNTVLNYLNTLNWSIEIPDDLTQIYDQTQYSKSMKYEKSKYNFSLLSSAFTFFIMYCILTFGGFGYIDEFVKHLSNNMIITTLYFFGLLLLLQNIISLPISYYSIFVIETNFGFNKMTRTLFFIDAIKSFLLSVFIGGTIVALVTWFYTLSPDKFWIYTWIFMTLFSLCMMMFYSTLIVPLFNKQTKLADGELRDAIEAFAGKIGFHIDDIYVIDGSKRSSKSNAYFSGFGSKKRVVLYDTLINDLTVTELVAVLAHEIGHYKKKHTLQMFIFSVFQMGFMLFILGVTLKYEQFSLALGSKTASFGMGIVSFGLLFTPLSMILAFLSNILSRKNEYEADAFAKLYYSASELKKALIKLSKNNLSYLRPHPWYEAVNYSHPTVLKRLKALDEIKV